MLKLTLALTTTGTTGAAAGAGTFGPFYAGELHAVYLDYAAVTSVTNVILTQSENPQQALLTVSDNATDGWYFPRNTAVDSAGAAVISTAGVFSFPVVSLLELEVSSSTPTASAVTAYVYIKEQ